MAPYRRGDSLSTTGDPIVNSGSHPAGNHAGANSSNVSAGNSNTTGGNNGNSVSHPSGNSGGSSGNPGGSTGSSSGSGGSSGGGSAASSSSTGGDSGGNSNKPIRHMFLDGMPPRRGAILITVVAEILADGLNASQLNVLGGFVAAVGDTLSYMASQHEFNEILFGSQTTITGQPETGETEEEEIADRGAMAADTAEQSGTAGTNDQGNQTGRMEHSGSGQADKTEKTPEGMDQTGSGNRATSNKNGEQNLSSKPGDQAIQKDDHMSGARVINKTPHKVKEIIKGEDDYYKF